jgi:hypothetical protein
LGKVRGAIESVLSTEAGTRRSSAAAVAAVVGAASTSEVGWGSGVVVGGGVVSPPCRSISSKDLGRAGGAMLPVNLLRTTGEIPLLPGAM